MTGTLIMSHPSGNANVRETARAFAERGMLLEFWTGVAFDPAGSAGRWMPGNWKRTLSRRAFSEAVRPYIRLHPWREAARLLADRVGLERLTRNAAVLGSGAVHVGLDRRVAQRLRRARGVEAVYCYDHAARETFVVARERGIRCFYDLPIGYWRAFRALADEESHIHPEWAPLDPFGGLPEEMFLRKDAEIAAADTIIVASSFTRNTLALAPVVKAPIHVIPYGAPAAPLDQPVFHEKAERLRVLFVGSLGVRKGLPYLLEAVGRLGRAVELTLIGRPDGACPPLDAALKTHRWIASLPHREILREMDRHDVLVFPSLFEGFGLVILEALSRGLPVITTPNTAGPDILEEGKDGFIIPIRSSDAIAEKLLLLHQDGELLKDMSANAIAKARRYEWRRFREAMANLVERSMAARAHDAV